MSELKNDKDLDMETVFYHLAYVIKHIVISGFSYSGESFYSKIRSNFILKFLSKLLYKLLLKINDSGEKFRFVYLC